MAAQTRAAGVDPRVIRTRTAVLAAATTLFLRSGFLGTSMDEIAEAAGLSKRTLYNNYADKEDLFREVVTVGITVAEQFAEHAAAELVDPGDLATALTDLARRLAIEATSPPVVRLRRLLIGEAHRFPDLAAEYYELAPGKVMSTIATALEGLAARGRLRVDDPARAAEQFAFLVLGPALDRALFTGRDTPPDPDTLARAADAGVRTFLAAYG